MTIPARRLALRLRHLPLALPTGLALAFAPQLALADCVADASGLNVTCSGTSAAYSNLASGVSINAASGATVTGPLIAGANGALVNAGTISTSAASGAVQFGDYAQITNNGTITSTSGTAGAAAIIVGNYGTVTNGGLSGTGTLSAVAGTSAVQFGLGGTFLNTANAPAAVTGNVVFAGGIGSPASSFTNRNVTYGFTGSIIATGSTNVDNAGAWTGSFSETAVGNGALIKFLNEATSGTAGFTGGLAVGDAGIFTNNGSMTVLGTSNVGSLFTGNSTFTNNGTLGIGTTSAAGKLTIFGSFAQSAGSTLSLTILPAGTAGISAGTNFSQVYASAQGTGAGTASLAGNLALNIAPGFYPTGSIYQLVVADKGITGTLAVSNNALPFLTFVPLGVVTVAGTQQAYEVQVQRTTTYAGALTAAAAASPATVVITPNQLAIARALQPVATAADAAPAGAAAALVGSVDVLTIPQAQAFLDSLSPAGYLAYAGALRDQANSLTRKVDLRLDDHNSGRTQDGFWGAISTQFDFGAISAAGTKSRQWAMNLGYDISSPKFVVGGVFSMGWDSQKYVPGTMSGTNRAIALGGYGAYRMGPLRASLQTTYTFGHLGAAKTLTLGSSTSTASAGASEHLFKATGTVGFDIKVDGLVIEPFVGIDYANGKVNGFTETGVSTAAALTVAPIDASRTDLIAGYSLSAGKGPWRPYLRTQYRTVQGTGPSENVTAYLNGDPTTSFTVAGFGQPRHEINTDLGFNYVIDDQGGFFFGYQGTQRGGKASHGISLGMRIEFE